MFEGFDEFFEEVFAVFERPDSWRLFPETREVLATLKAQGFELGIISNFDSRLFSVLRGLGIADLFDTITISSLAHAAKPSARIFQQALDKHAVEPADALHVGDSERDDVKGAQGVGLTGVLLARGEAAQVPRTGTTIASLRRTVAASLTSPVIREQGLWRGLEAPHRQSRVGRRIQIDLHDEGAGLFGNRGESRRRIHQAGGADDQAEVAGLQGGVAPVEDLPPQVILQTRQYEGEATRRSRGRGEEW